MQKKKKKNEPNSKTKENIPSYLLRNIYYVYVCAAIMAISTLISGFVQTVQH